MGNGVAQEILRLAGEWVRAAERFKDGHGTQPMVHEAKQQFYSFVIHGGGIVGDSRRASEMDDIQVQPNHYSYRPECTRENLQECLQLMAKDGMVEWRATHDPEGYPPGLYVEGWDRKLRWPERQADFNYPMTYATPPHTEP